MGIESFCLSPDLEHVMGFPFWEDSKTFVDEVDHWHGSKLNRLQKPANEDWQFFWSGDWTALASFARGGFSHSGENQSFKKADQAVRGFVDLLKNGARSLYFKLPSALQTASSDYLRWFSQNRAAKSAFLDLDNFFDAYFFYGPYAAFANLTRRPYVAFEHGTLRDWVHGSTPRQRRTRKGFQNASHVLVSNHDVLSSRSLKLLHLENVSFSGHPVTDKGILIARDRRRDLTGTPATSPSVFCPARHTWGTSRHGSKGTELLLGAIIEVCRAESNLTFHLVRWGEDVHLSEKAIRDNRLTDRVIWSDTLTRPLLREFMANSFCVIDQFKAAAFGGIGTDALGIGVPLLTRSDKSSESAIFGSASPAIDISSSETCAVQLEILLRTDSRLQFVDTSWYDQNLSQKVFESSLTSMTSLLQRRHDLKPE